MVICNKADKTNQSALKVLTGNEVHYSTFQNLMLLLNHETKLNCVLIKSFNKYTIPATTQN